MQKNEKRNFTVGRFREPSNNLSNGLLFLGRIQWGIKSCSFFASLFIVLSDRNVDDPIHVNPILEFLFLLQNNFSESVLFLKFTSAVFVSCSEKDHKIL